MGNSPTDMHTHDMLVFFLPLVVGPELAPPVHVDFSLPVLYFLQLSFPSERSELIFIDIGFLQEQHTAGSVLTLINKNSNSNYYIYNFPVY